MVSTMPTATEATAPGTALPILSHWIDGRPVEVLARADRPGMEPGDRAGHRPRAARRGRRGREGGRGRQGGLPGLAGHAAHRPQRGLLRLPRARVAAPGGDGRPHHPRPRQDVPGRARRGPARPRDHRVRLRPAEPAGRAEHPQRRHERRRLHPPPAAGRHGGDHALQLPGDGPDVDLPDRPDVRQHGDLEALLPHARRDPAPGRAVDARPAARPASSTSSTAAARR